ncbi:sulfatase [Aestuariivivens sediminicola]|uniref:sulfatase n=1 Tax=Aestuariivivens sediminicola TaxID=2913560 RepID=UPI001F58CFB2|nr:sulfatase [Aestuariivivens sediminicola]
MRTVKIHYLTCVLLTLSASLFGQEKPNVLFIAIDDLNDYVNCMHGAIQVPTPNIDRLAEQGALFTNAHCQAPICGPSRASIMTGLYPSTSGNYLQLRDDDIRKSNALTSKAIFMPDYFEQYGYKTMAVGKIYHNGDGAKTFDEYGGTLGKFGPKPKERFKYDPSKIKGKVGSTQTDWGPYPDKDELMPDFKSAKWAVNKLEQEHEKPFFLAVGFVRPHVPWYVPKKWFDLFPVDHIKTPPYKEDDYDDIPDFGKQVTHAPMMPTTEELIASNEWKYAVQAYMACTAFVDAQVGKVLDALAKSKYANNTIVVLWSDHGYHMGEKNRFAKQALWERDTRTVLIFKDIHARGGQTIGHAVQLLDIYPTLLELCHLTPNTLNEGHSLAGLIQKPDMDWPYPAISNYGKGNIAIRTAQYRLIQYEDGSQELYDMEQDPNEWDNLASSEAHQGIIRGLQQFIPKKWADVSAFNHYPFNAYFKGRMTSGMIQNK